MATVEVTLEATNMPEVDGLQVGDIVIQKGKPITLSVTNADKLAKAFPDATFKRRDTEPKTEKKATLSDAEDTPSKASTKKADTAASGDTTESDAPTGKTRTSST